MKKITQEQVAFLINYVKQSGIPARDGFGIVAMLERLPEVKDAELAKPEGEQK